MIANSGLNIGPFLDQLSELPDDTLVALLHADWIHGSYRRIWRTPFWEDVPGKEAVWDWYTSVELETRIWKAGSAGNMRAVNVAEVIAESPAIEPPLR